MPALYHRLSSKEFLKRKMPEFIKIHKSSIFDIKSGHHENTAALLDSVNELIHRFPNISEFRRQRFPCGL